MGSPGAAKPHKLKLTQRCVKMQKTLLMQGLIFDVLRP
jgi:hypothetical protein